MNRKYILPILLILQIILVRIVALYPEFIEKYYSNGFYLNLSKFSRISFGRINFSVGDVIYMILILAILYKIYTNRQIFFLFKKKSFPWKNIFLKTLSCVSVFYFFFNVLWGLNYHRIPLYEKLNVDTEYTQEELLNFTLKMIAKTNDMHLQLVDDKNKNVVCKYEIQDIYNKSLNGYNHLEKEFPSFGYQHPSIKESLVSVPLTYMGFGGYLNPFTNEAQVNYKIPRYSFPTTTCHEMAHQIGYASESEANFIGYLAAINNDDLYFKFSGYSYALKYCLANLDKFEEGKSKEIITLIHPGILKNYQETSSFWESYQTPIDTFFHYFYDHFLKANQQKDGLESYSKFVGLLVGYYKNKPIT